ncbi:SAM-dependent methyltransferase [Pseudonocardia zijingensis]|uniref:SAM-dependent methyltransferase n=1 Tax=Pseudonocardia zijingensis TaxID=153376 RepID=A0ABN1NAC2_9PSEU
MTEDQIEIGGIPTDIPTSARAYGWLLGGKENFTVDQQFMKATLEVFPTCLDIARENRRFLYRAVRHLTEEVGIRQFLDMGCGLPTDNNVHQVAGQFTDDARVVYVDIDPIVLAHARALLACDDSTVVVRADMRDHDAILANPDVNRLIDFSEPVAVLFLSVGHHILDEFDPHAVLHGVIDRAVPGSYLAFSQVVCDDPERGARFEQSINEYGIPWRNRSTAQVDELLSGLEPVEPGLVNLSDWRPTADQPALAPVPADIARYEGASRSDPSIYEYGGVLRKS